MNKIAFIIIAAATVAGATGGVRSEDHQAVMDQIQAKKIEHILDAMTQLLGLSKEQQTSVKAVIDDQASQMKAAEKSFSEEQKKIQDGSDQKITAVLTEDQKAKYPEVKAQLKKEEQEKEANKKKLSGGEGSDGKSSATGDNGSGHHHGHHSGGSGGPPGGG